MKYSKGLLVLSFVCAGHVMAVDNRDIHTEKFNELDADGNNHLTHDEIIETQFLDTFSEMDRNSDGRVSLREYKSYIVANPDSEKRDALDAEDAGRNELPKEPTSFGE